MHKTYLIVEMTPPRRNKLGCSVKQIILPKRQLYSESSTFLRKCLRPCGNFNNIFINYIKLKLIYIFNIF